MLPALAVTTPPASSAGAAARTADSAPRSLNEPIGCRYSSLSQISHGASTSSRTSGVRITASRQPLAGAADLVERDQSRLCFASSVSSVRTRPELGEHLVLDQAGEQLDRRALRADDVLADDPRDDLEVAEAPDADALVPLGQQLGELVELLVLAAARVDLEQREPALAAQRRRTRRAAAATRGGSRGSRASRSPSRGRARAAPPGTPTATSARGARGSRRRTSAHAFARRSSRSRSGEVARLDRAASPPRPRPTRASARAPTTGARSGRAARRGAPTRPGPSAARAARPCAGSARSRCRRRRAGSARTRPARRSSPRPEPTARGRAVRRTAGRTSGHVAQWLIALTRSFALSSFVISQAHAPRSPSACTSAMRSRDGGGST